METWVVATQNPGKVVELEASLHAWLPSCALRPLKDWTDASPDETGTTFVENAVLKARHACERTGLPALADDSGLMVDVLGGAPGVRSARFAGPDADFDANMEHLLQRLRPMGPGPFAARFVCVLVWMAHADDPQPLVAEGVWEGGVVLERSGDGGFGYDPVFWVPSDGCTAAELSPERKRVLSHRGHATDALKVAWQAQHERYTAASAGSHTA